MGSARDIGPGFFPALAGGMLTALGLAVIAKSIVSSTSAGAIAWRPLIGVLAPVALFAATLKTVGLALAAALLVGASLVITRQASTATALPSGRACAVCRGCLRLRSSNSSQIVAVVMDSSSFVGLLNGLLVAVEPLNLLLCFVGVLLGTLVGVLPA